MNRLAAQVSTLTAATAEKMRDSEDEDGSVSLEYVLWALAVAALVAAVSVIIYNAVIDKANSI